MTSKNGGEKGKEPISARIPGDLKRSCVEYQEAHGLTYLSDVVELALERLVGGSSEMEAPARKPNLRLSDEPIGDAAISKALRDVFKEVQTLGQVTVANMRAIGGAIVMLMPEEDQERTRALMTEYMRELGAPFDRPDPERPA